MIHISKNKCVGCGICRDKCPVNAICLSDGVAVVDTGECIVCNVCRENCPQGAIQDIERELLIAVGTDDNKKIKSDDHFGMSRYFQVWNYADGTMKFVERRDNATYKGDESIIHGDPKKAKATASVLANVDVLVGKMFGPNITRLSDKFVCAVVREKTIAQATDLIKENINEILEEMSKKERKGVILR
jgi:MinD superfamily P-loop ATPase